MKFAWQDRVGLGVSVLAFALVAEGAVRLSAKLPVSLFHRAGGTAVGVLAILWAVGLWKARPSASKFLILISLFSVLLGGLSEIPAWKASAGVGHAVLSHLFLSASLAIWYATRICENEPKRVEDAGWPSLRALAWATPVVILIQIALGAAYRHEIAGVVPHIVGAFLAAVFVLMAGAALFTTNGTSSTLRKLAGLSLTLLLVQILLGVAAYFARVSGHSQLVSLTVAHVLTGALLLTVNCILSSQIWKEVVTVRQSTSAGQLAGSGHNG